jgi:glycosidase
VEEEDASPESLLNTYRFLLNQRVNSPALFTGDMTVLDLNASLPGAWGFIRKSGADWAVCLYNFSDQAIVVTVPVWPLPGGGLRDLLGDSPVPAAVHGTDYTLTLPPASGVWLVPRP